MSVKKAALQKVILLDDSPVLLKHIKPTKKSVCQGRGEKIVNFSFSYNRRLS